MSNIDLNEGQIYAGIILKPYSRSKNGNINSVIQWKYYSEGFAPLKRVSVIKSQTNYTHLIAGLSGYDVKGMLHLYGPFSNSSDEGGGLNKLSYVRAVSDLWNKLVTKENEYMLNAHGFNKECQIQPSDILSNAGARWKKLHHFDVWFDQQHGVVFSFNRQFMKSIISKVIENTRNDVLIQE